MRGCLESEDADYMIEEYQARMFDGCGNGVQGQRSVRIKLCVNVLLKLCFNNNTKIERTLI